MSLQVGVVRTEVFSLSENDFVRVGAAAVSLRKSAISDRKSLDIPGTW